MSLPVVHRENGAPAKKFVNRKNGPYSIPSCMTLRYKVPTVIALVGLPARGKSHMGKKLSCYFNWIGLRTRIFNAGDYRRVAADAYIGHDYFNPNNEEASAARETYARAALQDMCQWLKDRNGEVAIFDATNSTLARRELIGYIVRKKNGFGLFFVESFCNDPEVIKANILAAKVNSADYTGFADQEKAVEDFYERIKHYERSYVTMAFSEGFSFLKIIDTGKKVSLCEPEGSIPYRVVRYLTNLHIEPRTIYLTRHGESVCNASGRIGGDSGLSERGRNYSRCLVDFIESLNIQDLTVYTSQLKRTIETAERIDAPQQHWEHLNEINAGICEGLTYKQIEKLYPAEFASRAQDKFNYRYPLGESYQDLIDRVEPFIMELERQEKNVLVVTHQAVLRCILGYFLNKKSDELPHLDVPKHTVMKLTPTVGGWTCEEFKISNQGFGIHQKSTEVRAA